MIEKKKINNFIIFNDKIINKLKNIYIKLKLIKLII